MTDGSVSLGGAQQLGVQQLKSTKSRNQILDAAIDVLISKGYAQASTLAIQEAAGVSRGRLLHHFPSRDDLLMAAVHHLARVRIEELPQRVQWPDDPIERISVGIDTGWSTFHQPYFVASIELWTAARTNERCEVRCCRPNVSWDQSCGRPSTRSSARYSLRPRGPTSCIRSCCRACGVRR